VTLPISAKDKNYCSSVRRLSREGRWAKRICSMKWSFSVTPAGRRGKSRSLWVGEGAPD